MRSSSKSKAQFFILSAFAIVSMLYLISRWMQPSGIIDTSQVALMEEFFVFNNVKEKAIQVVNESKSCEELKYNLDEYKNFVELYALEKGKLFLFWKLSSPCELPDGKEIPTVVVFDLNLSTPQIKIGSSFHETWMPGS
jgi:hypothetical protein